MTKKTNHNLSGLLYLISRASSSGFPFRIRLQKMILLGQIEFSFPFSFKYESHYYGPYSVELQSLLDLVILTGLVKEESKELSDDRTGYFYFLTEKGVNCLNSENLMKSGAEKIDKLWQKYGSMSTERLVREAKDRSGIKSRNE